MLVPDAHAIGMIGVIRSLGRAGYPVLAGASHPDALGLRSRFAVANVLYPPYSSDEFLPWLDDFVASHGVQAIVPSEGLLLAVEPCFERYSPLLPVGTDRKLIYLAFSKSRVVEHLRADVLGTNCATAMPASLVFTSEGDHPTLEEIRRLPLPIFVKTDKVDALKGNGSLICRCQSPEQAYSQAKELSTQFSRVLMQGHVPGTGVGVYFLMRDGEVVAEFMNRCTHEVPHTGGLCSLRESWFHQDIRDDALRKVRSLGWEGVIMMEYRWQAETGEFHFLETNARFWAALHLALLAGVDFPRLQLDLACGFPPESTQPSAGKTICRLTFPSEVGYVTSRLRDPDLGMTEKAWTVLEFLLLSLDPRVKTDLWFPGDRKLYIMGLVQFARGLLAGRRG